MGLGDVVLQFGKFLRANIAQAGQLVPKSPDALVPPDKLLRLVQAARRPQPTSITGDAQGDVATTCRGSQDQTPTNEAPGRECLFSLADSGNQLEYLLLWRWRQRA